MIITTDSTITPDALDQLIEHIESTGTRTYIASSNEQLTIACVGDTSHLDARAIASLSGVRTTFRAPKPHILVSRGFKRESSVVSFGDSAHTTWWNRNSRDCGAMLRRRP